MKEIFGNRKYLFIFIAITLAAILLRLCLFPIESCDYTKFLSIWFDTLKQNGGIKAIGMDLGDYHPSYLYILAILTHLPIKSLYSIKLISCIADFVLAYYFLKICLLKTHNSKHILIAYAAILFFPTVVMNSAAWGQCDSIYASALVACVYYFTKEKPISAMVAFSISFIFKLQAIFLSPFILLMLIKKRTKIWHMLIVPVVYLISIMPSALMGRSFSNLLLIYLNQTGTYSKLSSGATNLYVWINVESSTVISIIGIALSAIIVLGAVFYLYKQKFELSAPMLISLAFLSTLTIPFILPRMHLRYFYPAEVFSILYAFHFIKKYWMPVTIAVVSTFSYLKYFASYTFLKLEFLAFGMLLVIVFLVKDTITQISNDKYNC